MKLESFALAVEWLERAGEKLSRGESIDKEELQSSLPFLLTLLDFLVKNMGNENIDRNLLILLMKILGLDISYLKKREREKEREEEKEELAEDLRQQIMRLIIYEIYKIANPHQIAGETALENFINNVQIRGVEVALQYEGAKYVDIFHEEELKNLESHKHSFVESLKSAGFRGGGRGL